MNITFFCYNYVDFVTKKTNKFLIFYVPYLFLFIRADIREKKNEIT